MNRLAAELEADDDSLETGGAVDQNDIDALLAELQGESRQETEPDAAPISGAEMTDGAAAPAGDPEPAAGGEDAAALMAESAVTDTEEALTAAAEDPPPS